MSNLKKIKLALEQNITIPKEKLSMFFKTSAGDYAEHDKFLGVTNPNLRKIAKDFYDTSLDDLKKLLNSKFNEERLLALIILTNQYKKAHILAKNKIYDFYISNLDCINNWNLVDLSAHLILGAHIFEKPKDILMSLVKSNNLWHRRIAIVSTWYFIRQKDFEYTLKLSKMLLKDQEDLIHKATGWMLREIYKKNPNIIMDFLDQNCIKMPRTMLRYTIEKLPLEKRELYLKKRI